MSERFALAGRVVGAGAPCFVVAEAGVNHNGDLGLAHRLVDLAADAGADAVKFQIFDPDALASAEAAAAPYQAKAVGWVTQQEMLRALVLGEAAWKELHDHAAARGLVFLATAFDRHSADIVQQLGCPAYKVPSGELNHVDFVADLARRGRPLIISTGMGTLDEIESALAAAVPAPATCLLHCVTAYPAAVASSNLRVIPAMAARFGVPVGWSDHTDGVVTALGAVALGACLLEKHVTIDRRLPGPDHAASADPECFHDYVRSVRTLEGALGDGEKRPMPEEDENRVHARRGAHAARDLDAETVLDRSDVVYLRPAIGLAPDQPLVGRQLVRRIAAGQPITSNDLA